MTLVEKHLRTPAPIHVAGRWIKRYHVAMGSAPIPVESETAALAMLADLLPVPDTTPPAGFLVLHQGGDGAIYLNTYSWVWDNVLHMAHAAAAQPALGCPDLDPTHFVPLDRPWIGCIWELPPLEHERSAWVRHVFGADEPDLEAYLRDQMAPGPVGGPTR